MKTDLLNRAGACLEQKILLCGVNASYQYPSFGLRYLMANMGELANFTCLKEFTTKKAPEGISDYIFSIQPKILGLSAYIWNIEHVVEIAKRVKQANPDIHIVVGGPEVSHEIESQEICAWVDTIIQGEGDLSFPSYCQEFLASGGGTRALLRPRVLKAELPPLGQIKMPYHLYLDEDIKFRHLCVEISRGCPYKCQYCLSSLDKKVRHFDIELFLGEMEKLLQRGARHFKFIDRTFNLSPLICNQVLRFFLKWKDRGIFLHFEMVPDRLPPIVQEILPLFPPSTIQFEVGIQTLNSLVAKRVQRHNDMQKVKENFKFLTEFTHVHIHADLIFGLPGEDLNSFAQGFDQLLDMGPHEIQLGILKRLKGTPIVQHTEYFGMDYSKRAPFQVLATSTLRPEEVLRMQSFAKYWDRIHNQGEFKNTLKLLWREEGSRFWQFWDLVNFLECRFSSPYGLPLLDLTEAIFDFLVKKKGEEEFKVGRSLALDFGAHGARTLPNWLKVYGDFDHDSISSPPLNSFSSASLVKRQKRHLNPQRGSKRPI